MSVTDGIGQTPVFFRTLSCSQIKLSLWKNL